MWRDMMEDLLHCVVQDCVPFGAAAQKEENEFFYGFFPNGDSRLYWYIPVKKNNVEYESFLFLTLPIHILHLTLTT